MQKAAPWFEIAGRVAWKWRPKQLCSKIRTKLNLVRSASQNACKNDTRLAGLSEILTPPSSERERPAFLLSLENFPVAYGHQAGYASKNSAGNFIVAGFTAGLAVVETVRA